MPSLGSPHSRVPTHLVENPASNLSPALVIYGRESIDVADITVTATQIQLTDGGDNQNVTYTGKALREVAEEISVSSLQYEATALNDVTYLASGDLVEVSGDTSYDGGVIIRLQGHVIQYREDLRVRLVEPYSDDSRLPWFGRIDTGQVVKNHKGIRYQFTIPEYENQTWSTNYGKPFVDQGGIQPEKVDRKVLRVPRRPVFWDRGNIILTVNGVRQGDSVIEDVDEFNGFIFLSREIEYQDIVFIDYVYREQTYVYKDINLNPSINHMPQFVGQFVLYFLRPSADSVQRTWLRTVFHSVSPTLEGAISQIPRADIPVMLLGALVVRQVSTIDEVVVTDTRSRGGGIKEEKYDDAVKANRHMLATTDRGSWDVTPYPGNAVVVVDLPESLKNTVDLDEIQRRVRRHIALGVEPLIDFRVGE